MKFVALKASGQEVFVNPANVFIFAPSKGIIGTSVLMSTTGVVFEVDGSPSEVREKLKGNDKAIF